MTWWGVLLIGLGCFYLGYFFGVLMADSKKNDEIARLIHGYEAELSACKERYNELIMAVVYKFPNETRHQTALWYIREAETTTGEAQEQSKEVGG